MKLDPIQIDPRFHGPPDSGNGGYVCGCLSQFVESDAVAVRLKIPPPLATTLEVRDSDAGVALFDDNVMVAVARAATVALEPIIPPSFAEAEAASREYRGFASHWYPSCFVCGPDRAAGDGLRIFPGAIARRDIVACPWIPDRSLASVTGAIAPEFLWAALDCPGAFAFPEPDEGVVLLGELQVRLTRDVAVGERCVLVAWEIAHEGRKHHTATALYGATGDCCGVGLGVWIEVA